MADSERANTNLSKPAGGGGASASGHHRQAEPYISADTNLPEITVKAVVLGVVLSAVLSAANAYLGLFAGLTVSASIPAAVISMAVLKGMGGNILENNIVQTAASAGESVAAGVIFTIPALILLGVWADFDYWETTLLASFGGLLGVLFTIPLRRALITPDPSQGEPLKFPEGVATAEVLKVGERGGAGVRYVVIAGAIGALFKLGEAGLKLWTGVLELATYVGPKKTVAYFGSNLSPALVAVGYIVGLNVAVLVFVGGALNWWIAIPILSSMQGATDAPAAELASELWSAKTRYIGVGAMVVGGLWALIQLRSSLVAGVRSGVDAYRAAKRGGAAVPRTEQDMPMQWVGIVAVLSVFPLFLIFHHITHVVWVSAIMSVIMLIAAFLFSAVAGYMAGLVGSSNNPISGVTIATILTSSLLLLGMLGSDSKIGPAAAILIGSVVCCAAAIAGDNMQDLKAGHVLGATPRKQQYMQILGVVAAALVVAPVLNLLLQAYGIGVPTEAHPRPLGAPQASLMASVAKGVFHGGLPWNMVAIGAGLAVLVIITDQVLEARGSSFRAPVLAVAVGIYLPFELSVPILAGGLVAHFSERIQQRRARAAADKAQAEEHAETAARNGLLFGAGLITGEALIGITMAIPIVVSGKSDVLALFGTHEEAWPGVVLLLVVLAGLARVASARRSASGAA